jgi:hypothetical protein
MKKLKLGLAVMTLLIFACPMIASAQANKPYCISLPAYEGVYQGQNDSQTKCSKDTENIYGKDQCTSITGGGSYALQGNMINSDGVSRGDYHTCQEGFPPVFFGQTGTVGYLYYLRLRNNNSVSVNALAYGDWNCDELYNY